MTTTHIDFRTLPANIPSMCIPRVFPNIDEKRIRRIFDDLALGEIQSIDFVSKKTEKGESFNRIFVHFRRWFSNRNADTARERLLDGKEIKIIYDEPWFWKVSAYRPPAQAAPRPVLKQARPHIEFDLEEEEDRRQRPQEHNRPRPQEHNRPRPQEHRPRPQEHNRPRPQRQDIKKTSHSNQDEFGRDKTLRQDEAPAPLVDKQALQKADPKDINYNFIPTPLLRKRAIINKKPLKIEEDEKTTTALNMEEGEVEE